MLVGVVTVGHLGDELLGLFNLAVQAQPPVSELRTKIYAYPTLVRGTLDALAALDS